ncbi:thyrotropin-releasing hormone receptor [Biomphalaria glabrata]|nr:CAunnamed protein product [Biomphalaria glabrata]KAI8791903.1 CAunnamed protein product [Biomphalaria glabrata]
MSVVAMPPAFLSFLVNQTIDLSFTTTTPASTLFPALLSSTLTPYHDSGVSNKVGRLSKHFGNSDSFDATSKQFVQVADPVAMATGIVGNALLTLVFLITPLRLRPLSHALAGLGVVNLLYTVTCLLIYLTKIGVMVYRIPGACQVTTFVLAFSKSIEAWLIFISHLNRLNAHTNAGHESRRRRLFNTKFALLLLSMLVAAPLLHVLWSMETLTSGDVTFCVPMKETLHVHLTIRKLEMIASVFLPLTMITGVDLMLLLKLAVYYTFREEDEEDDMNIVHESPTPSNAESCAPMNERYTPTKDIVYVHAGARLSTIDELSTSIGKTTGHHGNDSIHSVRSEHLPRKGSLEAKSLLLDLGGKQAAEATSPISFHFLFDSLSQSGNSSQLATWPAHNALSIESLNVLDPKSHINTPEVEDVSHRANNDCIIVNVEILKSSHSEDETKQFNESHLDNKYPESNPPSKFYSFVLSNLRLDKCKGDDSYKFDFSQDSIASSEPRCRQKASSFNSFSRSQWKSYTYTSYASNTSRVPSIQEDHSFPNDVSSCTICVMMTGLLYAALVLPSSYTQALSLFSDSSSRPSSRDIQQAIVYEALIKLNAAYKCLMYFFLMPSFRYAIMWLITQWFPSKITRASSLCIWATKRENNELVYV